MVRPIAANIGVSFAYGVKYSNGTIHKGVDFSDGHEGHDVFSCLDGTVTHAAIGGGWGAAYGRHVIIKSTWNGKALWMLYGHLKTENVSVGQAIKAGQKIGTSGGAAGASYSGNSTGPHVHVQACTANVYTAYVSPWPMIDNASSTITPKTEKWTVDVASGSTLNGRAAAVSGKVLYQRKPGYGITTVGRDPSGKWAVTRYGTWYSVAYLKARGAVQTITVKVMSWNFKSPTLNGSWPAWSKRRGGQVTIVKGAAPDVLLGQEMGSPTNVKWYDAAFASLGLTNVKAWAKGTGKWREIYHRPSFSRITSGLYTIGPRLKGDDKQMAECILRDSLGRDWYFGSAHLENDDDTGDTQVAQIADCFKRGIEARDAHGCAPEHLVIGGDTNSRDRVRAWVEANTDYRDAFGLTPDATRAGIKSINGWKPLANGAREDYVFIHKSLIPSEATQLDGHEVSDHNPQVVTFTA